MKKTLALLLSFFALGSLSALVYSSNLLGQKLEVLSGIPLSGYALEENGPVSTLYLDGFPVRRTERIEGIQETTVTETDLLSGSTFTRFYSDGLLMSESGSDGSLVSYAYVEGRLAFCSSSVPGQESRVTFFLRSSGDGSLMAVKEGDVYRFISESYIFQDNELLQQVASDLVIKEDHEVLDDGRIRYEQGGIIYIYSPSGLLISAEENGVVSEYFYDGRTIARIETVDGNLRSVENYSDGRAVERLVYEDGILTSRTEYRTEGNIQVLYKNGRKVATVYYRQDNRTVDRIEYD
ncbi:MAG: hypothetical protein K6E89_08825 [Sphaerochaetaceae bacterium]|nr:hypothetical protein [Sphaerochaetaceae bacterium]